MNITPVRQVLRGIAPLMAVSVVLAAGSAGAISAAPPSSPPPSVPDDQTAPPPGGAIDTVPPVAGETVPKDYVQLVDDTGILTVAVPDTWTDVDTAPGTNDDGSPRPWISAAPDFEQFQETFDVPGVLYTAFPYEADPQVLIDEYGLTQGCESIDVEPYDDGAFTGLVQVGTSCGTNGDATWNMIAASPADSSFTALVQLQAATAADQEAFDTVLRTFSYSPAGPSIPGSSVPGSVSVADPVQLVTTAATGYRTFISAFEGIVYEDEDSIKVGDCPVIDVEEFSRMMSGLGLPGPYEAESGGEMELFDEPVEGSPLRPVGVFCDLDVADEAVTTVESASISVIDTATHPDAMQQLQPIIDAGGNPTTSSAGFPGDAYTLCGAPFDETECTAVWFGSELVVALSFEYATAPDPATTASAFESVLPAVIQQLASHAG